MDRYLVISSDTHAGPPSEAYREYIDPQYREAFDADLAATRGHALGHASSTAPRSRPKFQEGWESETGDGGIAGLVRRRRRATPSSTPRVSPAR